MKIFTLQKAALFILCVIGFASCQDKWDDHVEGLGNNAQNNLYEVVNSDAKYSKFADLLQKSGYADVLKSSKNFTLILPNNSAIDEVASTVDFTDSLALRAFVGYHIINSAYPVNNTADTIRAKNIRNKYIDFVNGNFNNIEPDLANQVAQNGIFHVVSHALTPYKNIYNFLMSFNGGFAQKMALLSFDTLKPVGDTILPFRSPAVIYTLVSPMLLEKQKYTYFILKDDFFNAEYSKLEPYFTTSYAEDGPRPDSTTVYFNRLNMLQNLIVPGDFSESNMPDSLTAANGFKFKVDKSQIISSHVVSNGRVYYVNSLPYSLKDQIREFKVLGKSPNSFIQGYNSGNVYYRTKRDLYNNTYTDIEVYAHKTSEYYINYVKNGAYKVKYKVYGRAISGLMGDPQTKEFTQYIQFFNPATGLFNLSVTDANNTTVAKFPYVVTPLNHDEVYLGEYDRPQYGALRLRLQSKATVTDNDNTLILEYLRFEPILP